MKTITIVTKVSNNRMPKCFEYQKTNPTHTIKFRSAMVYVFARVNEVQNYKQVIRQSQSQPILWLECLSFSSASTVSK
ncbi:hypothetical protein [Algibacter luteus]|uniref:hypothetical protein n=1 Tax=Algibacter luteus TaxID=1178825 RepID=UPI00138AE3FF|nr:hypothetical protein [Algibacter luteus]